MEIRWPVHGSREFLRRRQPRVRPRLVGKILGIKGGASSPGTCVLLRPRGTAATIAVAVVWVGIVTTAGHVVDDSVCVNADTQGTARVDGSTQFIAGAHAPGKAVADGLIHKIPRVQYILERLGGHDLLLRRKQLRAKVASLGEEGTLLCNGFVWPAKKLHNCALLAVAIVASLSSEMTRRREDKVGKSGRWRGFEVGSEVGKEIVVASGVISKSKCSVGRLCKQGQNTLMQKQPQTHD